LSQTRDRQLLERLAGLALTYPEVGATAGERLPDGYHTLRRSIVLGTGPEVFDRAADGLLSWELHRRVGFQVVADSPTAVPGSHVALLVGRRPLALVVPCRVVYTLDEPHRRGFGYGTLPGHPESGEEAFVVSRDDDEQVSFTVRAFSRPGTRWAQLGGPAGRLGQRLVTVRYLTTLKTLATE
jgi:uncharacterized protein (UPF0548 family)